MLAWLNHHDCSDSELLAKFMRLALLGLGIADVGAVVVGMFQSSLSAVLTTSSTPAGTSMPPTSMPYLFLASAGSWRSRPG